jgi:rhomboid family GlyGly-CTERM serine protease
MPAWRPVLGVAIVILGIGFLGDFGRDVLAFDRELIGSGQLWRLVSAHFVHTGFPHLILNLVGLGIVWYLVGEALKPLEWLIVWIVSIAGVNLGLWLLEPQLDWYVGLSGVLHGLIAAGLIASIRTFGVDLWIVLIAVVGKLVYEQVFGPMPGSESTTGIPVIVNAHLYGAIAGAVCGAVLAIRVRATASI